MRTDFEDAMKFVFEAEGGYTNDPNDPGGETNFGISKKAYPNEDIKNMTLERAMEIYMRDYWIPCKCDELPRAYAISLFDSAVNQGVGTAIKILQRALGGLTVDGVIGPKTLAAVQAAKPRKQAVFLAQRLVAYHELMTNRPQLNAFALNWFHRVVALAKVAL